MGLIHIKWAEEVDWEGKTKPDLRTREGREEEVLELLRQNGYFTVFWATDNLNRAHAIERLETTKRIVRLDKGAFPNCYYRVMDDE